MNVKAKSTALLVATASVVSASVIAATPASAVTGCNFWAGTDGRGYAQCSGGRGEVRAGAGCAIGPAFVGSTYGKWVSAGRVSVADCGFPKQISKRNGNPVVWFESR